MLRDYMNQIISKYPFKTNFWFVSSLFLLFVLAMNYTKDNYGGTGLQSPFNWGVWLCAGAFILVTICALMFRRRKIHIDASIWLYLSVFVLLWIPLIYNNTDLLKQEQFVLSGLAISLIFYVCLRQHARGINRQFVIGILLVSTTLQAVWGLIQFFLISEPSVLFFRPDIGRPFGVFQQVNVYSIYLGTGSLLAFYLAFFSSHSSNKFLQALLLALVGMHQYVLSLVGGNTSRVVVCIAILIYGAIILYRRKTLWIVLWSALAIAISYIPTPTIEQGETLGYALKIPDSAGTRPTIYSVAAELIQQKPILGHGFGHVRRIYLEQQADYFARNPEAGMEFHLNHVHNEPLQWFIQGGLVSFSAFLLLAGVWLRWLVNGDLSLPIFALSLPILGQSMLEYPLYQASAMLFMLIVILALAYQPTGKAKHLPKKFKAVLLLVGISIFSSIAYFVHAAQYELKTLQAFERSKGKTIDQLLAIDNPKIFKTTIEYQGFRYKQEVAVASGSMSQSLLDEYIAWAKTTLEHSPFEFVYEHLVTAYRIYRKDHLALQVAEEGSRLYPNNTYLRQDRDELRALFKQNASQPVKSENQ